MPLKVFSTHSISPTVVPFRRGGNPLRSIHRRSFSDGRVELLAPHGVDDLVQMIVRPTPAVFIAAVSAMRSLTPP
jgi:hypothetical protein